MLNWFKKTVFQKFGYIKDQQGILTRYFREKEGWDKHLENAKAFIIDSFLRNGSNAAVILGSGWLLDVPIEELSKSFEKVFLVDVNHPSQVANKVKKLENVELIQYDITGGLIEEISILIDQKQIDTSKPFPIDLLSATPVNFGLPATVVPDLVVSLNLMNQLDILICDYLQQKLNLNAEQLLPLRQFIQQTHLDSLPKGKTVLITDYVEHASDKSGQDELCDLIHVPFPKAETTKNWIWEFDYSGYYKPNKKVSFEVVAMCV